MSNRLMSLHSSFHALVGAGSASAEVVDSYPRCTCHFFITVIIQTHTCSLENRHPHHFQHGQAEDCLNVHALASFHRTIPFSVNLVLPSCAKKKKKGKHWSPFQHVAWELITYSLSSPRITRANFSKVPSHFV